MSVYISVFIVAVTANSGNVLKLLSIDVMVLNRVSKRLNRADRMLQISIIFF